MWKLNFIEKDCQYWCIKQGFFFTANALILPFLGRNFKNNRRTIHYKGKYTPSVNNWPAHVVHNKNFNGCYQFLSKFYSLSIKMWKNNKCIHTLQCMQCTKFKHYKTNKWTEKIYTLKWKKACCVKHRVHSVVIVIFDVLYTYPKNCREVSHGSQSKPEDTVRACCCSRFYRT